MATRDVTLRDMLHRAADWFPQGERVVDELFRYTSPQLREQVQRCAALYHALGVRKGDRVALLLLPSANHVVALFAASGRHDQLAAAIAARFGGVSDAVFASVATAVPADLPPDLVQDIRRIPVAFTGFAR